MITLQCDLCALPVDLLYLVGHLLGHISMLHILIKMSLGRVRLQHVCIMSVNMGEDAPGQA